MNNSEHLVSDIVEIISQTATTTLTNQNIKYKSDKDYLISFLDVTDQELKAIAKFIVEFLPQRIYLEKYQNIRNYVLLMISKELVFFLIQEDKKSVQFSNNIKNFKDEIVNEVVNNIYVSEND